MKILYIDCGAGAAGDMLMSALLELHPDPDGFLMRLNALMPDVVIERERAEQNGIIGTHLRVKVNGEEESEHMHGHTHHSHTSIKDITALINGLDIAAAVKKDAAAVYQTLAAAEAEAHGREPENIHFHEVGTKDAVVDIVGTSMLFNELGIKNIFASPINVGGGTVKCAHGILPVPAPATAVLLRGLPFYGGGSEGERCTPTGAALLKHFVTGFGDIPPMTLEKTGMGVGTKKFTTANILRVFRGDTADSTDEIIELCCNIDDMTGEDIAFACDMLLAAGAKDAFTVPIIMKKGRPAQLLSCITTQAQKDAIIKCIFKYTSTIGIREYKCKRYTLDRRESTVSTKYGDMRVKHSDGYGVERVKPEFEDIRQAALKYGLSPNTVRRETNL